MRASRVLCRHLPRLDTLKGGFLSDLEGGLSIQNAVEMDHSRDKAGPSSLMAGANSSTVITVEVFIEEDVIAPVWVLLKFLRPTEHGSAPIFIAQEDILEAGRNFPAHFKQVHHASRAG